MRESERESEKERQRERERERKRERDNAIGLVGYLQYTHAYTRIYV